MMMLYRTLVFAALSLMVGADVLLAQPMPPGMDRGTGGRGGALSGPQQEVKTLQGELSEEQKILTDIENELRDDFETKPEWSEAEEAFKQAQTEHDAARDAVLSKVYETPEYKAALERKFAAEAQVKELTASGELDSKRMQEATNEVAEAANEVREMETKALAEDPAVVETKGKLTDATAAMNALKKEFKESLELDEKYLTQLERVEDVKFRLAEARQRLAEEARRIAESKRQSDTQRRSSGSSRRNRGGGGRGIGGGY
jgi:chromosome segregation ATPase